MLELLPPYDASQATGQVAPLAKASAQNLSQVKALFFDIDDTFSTLAKTTDGTENRIRAEAYEALWRLYNAGIAVIPVTGRPAGWCDMIARMWPVTAVVGENGAFYCRLEKGSPPKFIKKYLESPATRAKNAKRLKALQSKILKKFPKAKTPSDQGYREFDLAIDYCEDVARWPEKNVDALMAFAQKQGAIAKLSSIHVNIWFGKYDKLTCVRKVMKDLLGLNPETEMAKVAYIGDSPNDEPFFEKLPLTFGVANVAHFLPKMKFHPKFITPSMGGQGFAELASALLAKR